MGTKMGARIDQMADPLAINMHSRDDSSARPTNAGTPLNPAASSASVRLTAINLPMLLQLNMATNCASGNTITIDFLRPNATGTAYVYFFSIFPQTKPDYGLAVWDASGTLILTNETRTLSDVVTLGTAGVDASSGYNINTTLAGKWACMPAMLGLITGVISAGGQPQPYSAIYKSMAKLEGSNTRIFARPQTTPGGNLQNVTYSNLKNVIMAINCDNYD